MPQQFRPGDYIGGEYLIKKVFGGEGASGMGVVYLVENRSFYEPFVLKTYQASELGDTRLRFHREAQAWVQLGSHPNIVRCLWVNEIGGDLYIAAQYVEPDEDGWNTLGERIHSGRPIPLDKQVRWATEFCYGMRHAYRKGIVAHRDLKPANLMLDQGSLKVTDFGLTRAAGQADYLTKGNASVGTHVSMQGMALGTPPYMAPEQFRDSSSVDHLADIYSFGVILYEMATGQLPLLPDREPKDGSEIMLLWATAHHRAAVRKADFSMFPIAMRCLEKHPSKRFQNFDEILAAIEKVAAAKKVTIPKENLADSKFDDYFALALSLVALGKPDEAIAKLGEITRRWPDMPGPFTEMGKMLLQRGDTEKSITWFKRAVEIDETRSAPWNNLGAAHARLGQYDVAEHAFASAIQVDSENTGAMLGFSQMLMEKGNLPLAWKWCERAYQLRPKKANVLRLAAVVAMRMSKAEEASIINLKLLELEPADNTALFNLALTFAQRKMLPEFGEAAMRYLEVRPADAEACKIFCQAFVDMGDMDEAVNVCLEWSKIKGAEVSGTINLAHLLAALGKNINGYVFLNKALERFPRHAGLWLTIAHVLKDLPQYREQARTAANNAAVCLKEPPEQPPRVTFADIEPLIRSLG